MDLWQGSLSQFIRQAEAGSLSGDMTGQFVKLHRFVPGASEVRSWEHSLAALASAVRPLRRGDLGIAIGATSGSEPGGVAKDAVAPPGVSLEYHMPLSGRRIDVMLTGHDPGGQATAMVVELKQWSEAQLDDEFATNLRVGDRELTHPSEQARDYAEWLSSYHSAFTDGPLTAVPLAYCHGMRTPADLPLRDSRFGDVLRRAPLFIGGEEPALAEFVASHVGAGDGLKLLEKLAGARFQPSKRVLDSLEAVLDSREEWNLLDEQRLAFNAIHDEVRRQQVRAGRAAVIVRGAPGTGKTVVAVQLLSAALRLGWKAAHSTGGKAFTTALRSKFKGADDLFIWNMNTRNAAPQGLDLLLVDEAHRVRESSDTRWTPKVERGKRTQVEELVAASKVTVFLLDENQFVRPDEVGSSDLIRAHLREHKIRFKEFDLATQFRCGGCVEYVNWVDWLLGFSSERPVAWGDRYRVSLVDDTAALDRMMAEAKSIGETARLVAGFCWKWSSPSSSGDLIPDVEIGAWRRPWNRKAEDKTYKPAEHPYTKWAETPEGEGQVGCIYSAQGFEFSRAGVIWGEDLVWRTDGWVAQPKKSHDRPVKASKEMLRLVRNAYRVLLTRGLSGVSLLILDQETRAHVASTLEALES